jgi:predicted  nucleic acid-binding Zn-ribbon protein
MKTLMQNLLELQTLEFGKATSPAIAATIADLRSKIPAPILGHYDRLRSRGKKGLAIVVNQVCTGCHMSVPIGAILTIKHGQDIQLCESCGRYLYLPAEETAPPAEAPVELKPARTPRRRSKSPPRGLITLE